MKILLVDNYDSFTYNLRDAFLSFNVTVDVVRNDKINFDTLSKYDGIVLSPGPGIPERAGDLKKLILSTYKEKPILGICLGMQAIAEVLAAKLELMPKPLHGQCTLIDHNNHRIFNQVPSEFEVGRYHSWVVNKETINPSLEILSEDKEGQIMALKASGYKTYGLQFHPESIMTPSGNQLIQNFLNEIR